MTLRSRISLAALSLLLPALALAIPPGITGIRAQLENGRVRVQWTQATTPVANYAIYYSHQSILANEGQYDDFELVDGSVNSHLLERTPTSA